MRALIVGAGGTLGTLAAEGLSLRGWQVTRAARADGDLVVDVLHDDPWAVLARANPRSVLYLAWATRDRSERTQAAHADAARRWAAAAASADVPFVFVSTTLAAVGVRSAYGRWKARAEVAVAAAAGSVARVGLVIDDALPGLLATSIRSATRRAPVLARGLDWPVFPVGSGDLVNAFAAALRDPPPRLWVAEASTTSLAAVAAWPGPAPRPARWRRIGRAVAAVPVPAAVRPALIDGWAGLVSGPTNRDREFPPPGTAIGPPGTWHAFTRPA